MIVHNKAGMKRSVIENTSSRLIADLDIASESKKLKISESEEDHYEDMD